MLAKFMYEIFVVSNETSVNSVAIFNCDGYQLPVIRRLINRVSAACAGCSAGWSIWRHAFNIIRFNFVHKVTLVKNHTMCFVAAI